MSRFVKHLVVVVALPAIVMTGLLVATMGGSRSGEEFSSDTLVAVGSSSNNANPVCSGKNNANCTSDGSVKSFTVTVGNVAGMYPGSEAPISVTFGNPQSFAITVKSVTASAALHIDASHAAGSCDGSNVSFGTPTLPVQVPAKGTTGISIPVGLVQNPPNPCKGARFTITVTATAVNS